MTEKYGALRRTKVLWLSAWPLWLLAALASLTAVRLLPTGYIRTILTAPILLVVPGSLTLGAIFSQRRRPRGAAFAGYAALLSAVWLAFASLALYVGHVLITANSTYWSIFLVSAMLALVAEARVLLGRGSGRRVARKPETLDPDQSDYEADDASVSGAGHYAIAVLAGVGLLGGGLYAYDHLPRPAPTGYTWMAWTGPPIKANIAVGSVGTKLGFQVVHHEPNTSAFRLSAAWLGASARPLTKPLSLSIGPNRTYRAALFVPPLPNGCTYRIVVVLTAVQGTDASTQKPRSWTINADVYSPGKARKTCK